MRSLAGDVIKQAFSQQTDEKLHRRLYAAICSCILEGSLKPATRMPPSRDLAGELTLSRNTVLRVYEQLQAEGYISARTSSGTFVSDSVLDNLDLRPNKEPVAAALEDHTRLSARCLELLGHASASPRQWGAFIPGVPDVQHFPHRVLKKIQDRLARRLRPAFLTYDAAGGVSELKEALADYLRTARGVRCSPDQILITEGIHQALDLVTRALCNPGDSAWIEEPGYWGIKNILRINAVHFSAIPVDEQGMIPPGPTEPAPKLIFVTPSHQYPLGSVMSLSRRQQLLLRARETRSWIIEDDYDSEFRFSGQPIPSLQGLEEETPVIYIGTFSKTLYPALRLGYVVLPKPLAAPLKKVHNDLYRGGHLLIQAALAEFIREGYYAAHIRKMRQLYSRRRQMLVELITRQLGEQYLGSFSSNAGLHMILQLPAGSDDVAIARQANAQDLLVRPLSRYYVNEEKCSGLLLGFASIEEHEMAAAFTRLATIIRENAV
ncbi:MULTISPECIES: PLP-dependent aminotransferase family protein [Citrobacter]|uniref:MocR-like pyridoxine biosynthesis transcription factor PdxR n=1 Tax=Citrobacter TaxID=544 RepID=UPI0010C99037|nr:MULTISPECIES: PLP-dependent aminotransferase family protein [Citrobacter]MBJ8414644.1 PLP-dependent aminotransferase family protein [Citrobacter cronae]MCM8844792.1 PLP-dependent aminotransferase family protein [Citrobacter cronae]MCU6184023.1 PLP-dependent aminotransferase family protein [Citrobacter cronae]MCU6195244.1 PLP-dependent aminotransferase family protein [Citrobacter cronae]TKU31901.1 PLP-dependent aminotransferase family protein [Citrobacter sp. wls717]